MSIKPYLTTPEQKAALIKQKGYFGNVPLTDDQTSSLDHINFHYFLGYAKNYGMLQRRGIYSGAPNPQDVFDLIDIDRQISALLFSLIRDAELHLRNLTVQCFCEENSPTSYLNEERLQPLSREYTARDVVAGILKELYRYDEDYVVEKIKLRAAEMGVEPPRRYTAADHDKCLELVSDIELWGAIDAFTLGQLGKFIMASDAHTESAASRTWRKIARAMEINAGVFSTGVESLAVTRNLICHHARLWMRPANNSPKKPKVFNKDLRSVDPKSQLMAFANIALFQVPSRRQTAMDQILGIVNSNPLYRYGITQTSHKERGNTVLS